MDKVTMGARFKQARLSKHITQEALAETCECGTTYISDIERGAKFPSMALFIRLVNALDVSPDFILRGELNSGKSYVYDELTKKLENLTPQQRENVSVMIDAYLKTLK